MGFFVTFFYTFFTLFFFSNQTLPFSFAFCGNFCQPLKCSLAVRNMNNSLVPFSMPGPVASTFQSTFGSSSSSSTSRSVSFPFLPPESQQGSAVSLEFTRGVSADGDRVDTLRYFSIPPNFSGVANDAKMQYLADWLQHLSQGMQVYASSVESRFAAQQAAFPKPASIARPAGRRPVCFFGGSSQKRN